MRNHIYRATYRPPAAAGGLDPDAARYITAVEAADGQPLEEYVRVAVNSFVMGCKADGTWEAIKACCILAGARTLAGALVPLVGAAPTNEGFTEADYDRKTGPKGDGTSKQLLANRANNADPQDSRHLAVWRSEAATRNGGLLGSMGSAAGHSHLYTGFGSFITRSASSAAYEVELALHPAPNFYGSSRSDGSGFTVRISGTDYAADAHPSQTPTGDGMVVFETMERTNARLAFYSIGEHLDLALLEARVTALVSAIAAEGVDPDAQRHIADVEAADGQPLEAEAKVAINNFITRCKADGIWDAMECCCLLSGAATKAGALVPLKGPAPTLTGTDADWTYDRKTGLKSSGGAFVYLNTGYGYAASLSDNIHAACYVTEYKTTSAAIAGLFSNTGGGQPGETLVTHIDSAFRAQTSGGVQLTGTQTGLYGVARGSADVCDAVKGASQTLGAASPAQPLNTGTFWVYGMPDGSAARTGDWRVLFYSFGSNLDLTKLRAIGDQLLSDLAAIP